MQVLENDGHYQDPERLNLLRLQSLIKEPKVRRVLVFPAYEGGKPTPELRRAWRRANKRTR